MHRKYSSDESLVENGGENGDLLLSEDGRMDNKVSSSRKFASVAKKVISWVAFGLAGLIVWDALFSNPENRLIRPDFSEKFLIWVQANPGKGLLAFVLAIAIGVITMIPIGTPLTIGCGYIYKGAYGWQLGLPLATAVSMGGSALGAVSCFLLGRYLMRNTVRQWVKKYPLFDAIDIATAEHGLKIMAMLYLTPVLPLGPVSYMCGTTSMRLSHFVIAKIASTPLMFFFCFVGASTGSLITTSDNTSGGEAEASVQNIEENEKVIVAGLVLSFIMITGITHQVKKELNKILERQKKHKPGETAQESGDEEEAVIEMGVKQVTARRRVA